MYVFGGRQDGYPCDVASTNTNRRGLDDIDPSMPTTTFCRTEGAVVGLLLDDVEVEDVDVEVVKDLFL